MAHTPRVIIASGRVGQYSVMPSNMFGTKPPMTKPKPLSIQSEMNSIEQAKARIFSFFLSEGKTRTTREVQGKYARSPHQWDEFSLAIDAGIQVMKRFHMSGYIAVEGGEKFHSEQEDVCEHRIGDDLCQRLYRLCSRVKFR